MRRALVIALVLLSPGTAQAATLGRNGSELVYRSDPGQRDDVFFQDAVDDVDFSGPDVTPGEGCRAVTDRGVVCELEGIKRFRIVGGDGDDSIAFKAALPVIADLGPGGDRVDAELHWAWEGSTPLRLAGGDGDDRITLSAAGAGSITLRRRVRDVFTPREFVARGRFDQAAGPLRVRLHTTPTGRRWLRRDPKLPLFVYIRTREGRTAP